MFIDVTPIGRQPLRLATRGIAYLEDFRSGCHIQLLGGDYLRVDESRIEVELRARSAVANDDTSSEPAPAHNAEPSAPVETPRKRAR